METDKTKMIESSRLEKDYCSVLFLFLFAARIQRVMFSFCSQTRLRKREMNQGPTVRKEKRENVGRRNDFVERSKEKKKEEKREREREKWTE